MPYPARDWDAWLIHWATKTTLDPMTGCWPWPGSLTRDGYGLASFQSQTRPIHVVVHEMLLGPIPEGYEIDHVWEWGCRNKSCWWIGHLEAVTRLENIQRREAARTHCKWGHPFDAVNTYYSPTGMRQCIACRRKRTRAWQRAYRARLRAQLEGSR